MPKGLLEQNGGGSLYDGVLETYPDGTDIETGPPSRDDVHEFPGDAGTKVASTTLTPAGVMPSLSSPRGVDHSQYAFFDHKSVPDELDLLSKPNLNVDQRKPPLVRTDDPELWTAQTLLIPQGAKDILISPYDYQRFQVVIFCIAGVVVVSPMRGVQQAVIPGTAAAYSGTGVVLQAAAGGQNNMTVRAKGDVFVNEVTGAAGAQVTINVSRYET